MGKYVFPSLLTTSSQILPHPFSIIQIFIIKNVINITKGVVNFMKTKIKILFIYSVIFLFLLSSIQASLPRIQTNQKENDTNLIQMIESTDPKPPEQPDSGPGGANYSHFGVKKTRHGFGGQRYWIFEPYGPKPESAPVIVFNHGFTALNPIIYREWIYHLVKRGNIVIYPRYQQFLFRGGQDYANNAITAVQQALQHLQNTGSIQLELENFAITGHSLGGGITMYMAAVAQDHGLPIPKAIMPVQPFLRTEYAAQLSNISEDTLMVVLVGEDDTVVGNYSGKYIFYNTPQIPLSQKQYIIQVTDDYGTPSLVADHYAPLALPFFKTVDAMDYYSNWKLFDALTDYAFYQTNKHYWFGDTPEQRFMGLWSDGTPVNELIVTNNP